MEKGPSATPERFSLGFPDGLDAKEAAPCHRGFRVRLEPGVRAGGEGQPLPVLPARAPEWKPPGEQVPEVAG